MFVLGVLNRGDHMDRFDCNIIVMFVLGVLNRGNHMDRFDCNIIAAFVLGVLNRGDHMDRFDLIDVMWSHLLSETCPCGHLY
jgi:uncharacterized membrane protein YvlD (DUF360 family)